MSGRFGHILWLVLGALVLTGASRLLLAAAPAASPLPGFTHTIPAETNEPRQAAHASDLTHMSVGLGVLRLDVLDTIAPGTRTFLEPNAPNPFAERTRIGFSIAAKGVVTLRVFDFWYREVATLVNEERNPGRYLAFFDVSLIDPIPDSGMYFYELRFGGETIQRRMLLIK